MKSEDLPTSSTACKMKKIQRNMIYRIIRIHSSEGGHLAVTPILNLCNQLETHFYSRTVAVIYSVTWKRSDNKYSPQQQEQVGSSQPSYLLHSRTDGT